MSEFKENIFVIIFKFILGMLSGLLNLIKGFLILLIEFIPKISSVIISFIFFFVQYQLLIKYDPSLSIYQPQCLVIAISAFYCWAISNSFKHLPVQDINIEKINNKKIKYIVKIHENERGAVYCFALIHFAFLFYFVFTDFPDLLTRSKLWWILNLTIVGFLYVPAVALCIGFNNI